MPISRALARTDPLGLTVESDYELSSMTNVYG